MNSPDTRWMALVVTIVTVPFLYSCTAEPTDEDRKDVRRVFDAHQIALENGDGAHAAKFMSLGTLNRFEELADLALTGDESTIRSRPILDRVMILSQRHLIPAEELRKMTGASAYARTIEAEKGVKAGPGRGRQYVGNVQITSDQAFAEQIEEGQGAGRIHFLREGGEWRIDLLPTLDEAGRQLEKTYRMQGAGMSEDEWLMSVIHQQTGREVDSSIWSPPDS